MNYKNILKKRKSFIKHFGVLMVLALTLFGLVPNLKGEASEALIDLQQTDEDHFVYLPVVTKSYSYWAVDDWEGWPMVGADPQRTSRTADEVSGFLDVVWYRPIEAYIPQNSQIIASNGYLYISTARGLYALNPVNGDIAWRP
jgi:hypothetical protein